MLTPALPMFNTNTGFIRGIEILPSRDWNPGQGTRITSDPDLRDTSRDGLAAS